MIKFSIITINYNNAAGLQRTIQSVINQTYKSFEYIVVDGASEDESQKVMNDKRLVINGKSVVNDIRVTCICEPDSGIYNAMNKGIRLSSGDFLLFLNSGDVFYDNSVLEKCAVNIDEKAEICSGILRMESENKKVTLNPPKELGLYQSVYNHLTHPNTFIKRSLFNKYGLYNENNKIVSDWEFFFVATGLNECKYQPLDVNIVVFYEDGISSSNLELQETEKKKVMETYLSVAIINELEERHQLENEKRQSWIVYFENLKKNKFIFSVAVFILKFLNKVSGKKIL